MARAENLHDVGFAMAGYLRRNLNPALDDVVAGPPLENPAAANESIRITLLWVTPQPTHRNDPWIDDDAGLSIPPPVSLSGFYLVTTYGVTDSGEPQQAYNRLGDAIRIFDVGPIDLPLPDDPLTPEIDPTPGEGLLTITLVPTAADLMEKVFSPLQLRHRPWALFEVGPIQLQSLLTPGPGPDIVHPGGVRLGGPEPTSAPVINAVAPLQFRAGGRISIDTLDAANAESLRIGDEVFRFVDVPVAVDEIARADEFGRVFVTYPAAAEAGDVDIVIRSARSGSNNFPVTILDASDTGVDAPIATVSIAAGLNLTGQGLTATQRVVLWPDRGIQDPTEVINVVADAVTDTTLTLNAATLTAEGARRGRHRLSLRIADNRFTPFVIVEFVP
ncbi:MAG: DUF4255 domain-containing protein [bacterium]|nr:DUF4255 domain-containing protein [bacterium]